jgi:hypothetical protein
MSTAGAYSTQWRLRYVAYFPAGLLLPRSPTYRYTAIDDILR